MSRTFYWDAATFYGHMFAVKVNFGKVWAQNSTNSKFEDVFTA